VPRDWDAAAYHRLSDAQEAMGREVLERLELRGDERVLDAGCGTGRVTAALLERLPAGEVVAVDGSLSMAEEARARLGDRADVRVSDLLELELERPVDAILSTATLHWVHDHDRLFARLLALLRPGGRLVAQCGGEGNVGEVEAAIARVHDFGGWSPWNFAGPSETAVRLRRLGWTDVWTWRNDVAVRSDAPRDYLATVVLGSHLERLPEGDRDAFVDAVLEELEEPVVRYVRLNILARRP
jgi:trans-aconitate 2-methyltransferase